MDIKALWLAKKEAEKLAYRISPIETFRALRLMRAQNIPIKLFPLLLKQMRQDTTSQRVLALAKMIKTISNFYDTKSQLQELMYSDYIPLQTKAKAERQLSKIQATCERLDAVINL